jgi:hypothetical protein
VTERIFPIMQRRDYEGDSSTVNLLRASGTLFAVVAVPWEMIEQHEAQAKKNHGQTVQCLAARGGLSACEALAVIEDRPFRGIPEARSHARLLEAVMAFNASRPSAIAEPPCGAGVSTKSVQDKAKSEDAAT